MIRVHQDIYRPRLVETPLLYCPLLRSHLSVLAICLEMDRSTFADASQLFRV